MSAAVFNPTLEQGASFAFEISCLDINDDPVDLTGCTYLGQARRRASDGVIVTTLTVATQGTPTDGVILVSLTAAQTAALVLDDSTQAERKITSLSYDIYVTFPSGSLPTLRVLQGIIQASPSDSRA